MHTLFTLILIALFTTAVSAQNWERTAGPTGGNVSAMMMHSSGDLYVSMGQSGENYKSSDNGQTWEKLPGKFVYGASQLAEGEGGNLYAAIPCGFFGPCDEGSGLFMSTDDGSTWEKLSVSGYGANSMHIAKDGTMLLGLAQGFSYGMMRSVDGGKNWSPLMPTQGRIQGFTETDSAIYAAATFNGLQRSTNGGQDWEQVTVPCGEYCETNGQYISNVEVSGDGALFVADAGDGIYITSDEGQTWERAVDGFATDPSGVFAVWGLITSVDGNVYSWLYNTLMYQYAGDGSWLRVGGDITNAQISNAAVVGPNAEVWVGAGDNGIMYYETGSDDWTRKSNGIVNASASSMVASSDGSIFAGDRTFSRSDDLGETWTPVTFPRSEGLAINHKDEIITASDSLFISRDKAATWENLGPTPWSTTAGFVKQVEIGAGGDAFVVYQDYENNVNSIYRLNPEMTEWSVLDFQSPNIVALECAEDGSMYMASGDYDAMTVYTSKDNGDTWNFTSGRTFEEILNITKDGETLYMGTVGLGVLRSTDDGLLWEERNNGLIAGFPSIDGPIIVNILQAANGDLIASNFGQGLMISSDEGESWTDFNEGLTDIEVSGSEGLLEVNNVIFLGTFGRGVYSSEPLTTSISYPQPQRGTFRVAQNFPNPFTDDTSIPVTLEVSSQVNIAIYDQTGRLVSQVFEGELQSGNHLFTVDAAHNNMAPGTYYGVIKSNEETATMKMVVTR